MISALRGKHDEIHRLREHLSWRRVLPDWLGTWLVGEHVPPHYRLGRWLFVRGLGFVALVALVSLWAQIGGLIGEQGILPAQAMLDAREATIRGLHDGALPTSELLRQPTIFWWAGADDPTLHAVCALGVLVASLLLVGVWPRLCLALLWGIYLSLTNVGQVFLGYQWDALLIEALFVGILIAPRGLYTGWGPSRQRTPRAGLWLAWLLVFKLMFLSGVVKLGSDDPTWESLTALEYHWWTQPLPAWTAWHVAKLPDAFHEVATFVALAIELAVPWLIFGPRRLRHVAAAAFALLQVGIMATGTYGFFNILSLVLCVPLVDDRGLRALVPKRWRSERLAEPTAPGSGPERVRRILVIALAILVTWLNIRITTRTVWPETRRVDELGILDRVELRTQPFRTVNGYGLFAVMTTRRLEIELEGSHDGRRWHTYEFAWKPDRLGERPAFATPHMPRLDWQMWFAALGPCSHPRNGWFLAFQKRLLEGSPAVTALLAEDPFSDGPPPRFVRTRIWRYRFGVERWWQRDAPRAYCGTLTLTEDGELARIVGDDGGWRQ